MNNQNYSKLFLKRMIFTVFAVVVAQMFSAASAFAATRVVSDGFDSGSTSQWQSAPGRDRCVTAQSARDGGGTQAGARMLECNWNGLAAWNANNAFSTLELPSWQYSNEFFVRLWVRLDADVDNTNGAKWMRFYNLPHNSYIMQRDGGNHSELEWVEGVANPPGAGKWDVGNLNDRLWQKYEWYWKVAPAGGGALHIWVNNVLTHSYTGWSGDPAHKWYPLVLTSNWSNNPGWEHDADNHLYFDSIEIFSDSTSGEPTTGSMSDGSVTLGSSTSNPAPTSPSPPSTPPTTTNPATPSSTTPSNVPKPTNTPSTTTPANQEQSSTAETGAGELSTSAASNISEKENPVTDTPKTSPPFLMVGAAVGLVAVAVSAVLAFRHFRKQAP